jgi:hypothetical protein
MPRFRRPQIRRGLADTRLIALATLLGLGLAPSAWAEDPPTRVGRLAVVEGSVSFHPKADDPWAAAALNYPLATSSSLWTEPGSRAEIEIGAARIRLDGGTELDVVQLDDQTVALAVPQGRIDISLHEHPRDERYIVQTPRGDVDLSGDGTYRLVAGTADEATRIASFTGRATVTGPQSQLTVNRNEEAVIGTGEPPSIEVASAGKDSFDHWSDEREHRIFAAPPPRFVSQGMPGAGDLDEYGAWRDTPDYGHVWIPTTVEVGWAPYRHGHWAFVQPWGWTWVDDAPWGFAPFHYGRWVEVGNTWGWIPGAVVVHPVYAPALVAWVGEPDVVVRVHLGGPSVGWIPLGPGELWSPPFATSVNFIRNANVTNVNKTVINNITTVNNVTNNTTYVNQKNVTVVSQQTFATAAPIAKAALPVAPIAANQPIHVAATPAASTAVLPTPAPAAHPMAAPPAAPLAIAHPMQANHIAPPAAAAPNAPTQPQPGAHPVAAAKPVAQPPQPAHTPTPAVAATPGVPTPHAVQPAPGYHPPAAPPPRTAAQPADQAPPHRATPAPQQHNATPVPQTQGTQPTVPTRPHNTAPVTPMPQPVPRPQPPASQPVAHPQPPTPPAAAHPQPPTPPPAAHPPQPAPKPEKDKKPENGERQGANHPPAHQAQQASLHQAPPRTATPAKPHEDDPRKSKA